MNKAKFVNSLRLLIVVMFAGVLFSSCAPIGVEVWERDVLASPDMQLDKNLIDHEMDDHIYFSKEGSSGGRGFGGGGCGCN